jgi:chloramphenicol-sensitive protein RarD
LTTFLLIMAGMVTALPLFWFGIAANKIPLSTIGFLQYISPTLQLLVGIVVFGEAFTAAHVVCFCCIWAGLALYSGDMIRRIRIAH